MIEKIEDGRISLEIPILEILGIPDPAKFSPTTKSAGEGELNIPGKTTLGSPATIWIKTNWFWLAIIGLLVVVLLTTK